MTSETMFLNEQIGKLKEKNENRFDGGFQPLQNNQNVKDIRNILKSNTKLNEMDMKKIKKFKTKDDVVKDINKNKSWWERILLFIPENKIKSLLFLLAILGVSLGGLFFLKKYLNNDDIIIMPDGVKIKILSEKEIRETLITRLKEELGEEFEEIKKDDPIGFEKKFEKMVQQTIKVNSLLKQGKAVLKQGQIVKTEQYGSGSVNEETVNKLKSILRSNTKLNEMDMKKIKKFNTENDIIKDINEHKSWWKKILLFFSENKIKTILGLLGILGVNLLLLKGYLNSKNVVKIDPMISSQLENDIKEQNEYYALHGKHSDERKLLYSSGSANFENLNKKINEKITNYDKIKLNRKMNKFKNREDITNDVEKNISWWRNNIFYDVLKDVSPKRIGVSFIEGLIVFLLLERTKKLFKN